MYYKALLVVFAILTVCFVNQIGAQEFITDGLVSFWSFDSGTVAGDTVQDIWGNNHGTMVDANIVPGKINEGVELNGSTSYVQITSDASLDITDAITIEAWIKLSAWQEDPNRNIIVARYNSGEGKRYIQFSINPSNGLATYIGHSAGSAYAQTQKGDRNDEWVGTWVHMAFTWDYSDGGLSKLYVDGQELETYANQEPVEEPLSIFPDVPWVIGSMPHQSRMLAGVMDEVRIYNRRLNDGEIMRNFGVTSNVISAVQPTDKLATTWGEVKGSI